MLNYTTDELKAILNQAEAEYASYVKQELKLDMSRGKPSSAQLDLSNDLFDIKYDKTKSKVDYRNYGILEGIPEIRGLFADLLGVTADEIIALDGTSLAIMYGSVQRAMQFGVYGGSKPWGEQGKIKFLCPVPGYDRHFAITEKFGIEMINVPMTMYGPDMDMVEKLVSTDASIKGIWCVPKYSNPDGITYSPQTVKRFASLRPAADDFRIFWDNAYFAHEVYGYNDELVNILQECKKAGNEDMVYMFASTSKITFPGAGVSCVVMSKNNVAFNKKIMGIEMIGPNKLNQWRHYEYFKTADNVYKHMAKHAEILKPKFDAVTNTLDELKAQGFISYNKPRGGYFVSVFTPKGTAKEVIRLCNEAGVVFTPAGSTYPYKNDPDDSNIRLAPSLPPVDELEKAIAVFAVAVKIAAVKQALGM
ncbi:MAG: aminotransferase class I/II-fold pyridoxal phosphate-dependent enzyme [Clostridia bacterium]|nr:aminotransferase class I/II-fold pyridoxal phosphate-dependent enzyme [Clostridia bacterium]